MTAPDAEFLIVGGDSQIGAAVRRHLAAEGADVRATSRRSGSPDIAFDLAAVEQGLPRLPRARVALIAAGIANQVLCADPAVRKINVDNTLALARHLAGQGARVVFMSTNLVFDGAMPNAPAEQPCRPQSDYGRHKAEAEDALLHLKDGAPGRVSVVRLSKVIHRDLPLLRGWIDDLKAGKRVRALSDLIIAPVSLNYTVAVLARVMRAGGAGIYQMSGAAEMSYAELARALARRLDVPDDLVEWVTAAEANVPLAAAPRHPSLDATPLAREFGITPQPLHEVIDELVAAD